MNFCSDNVAGVAPEIFDALREGMAGSAMPYGSDPATAALTARCRQLFETDALDVLPVATGTAANALALAVLAPPYGAVYCHRGSHIEEDECGAPEFFTGGAKLVLVDGPNGKLTEAGLAAALATGQPGNVHRVQPAAISLTNASEAGTVYSPDEAAALAALARRQGLGVHLDGARFANAVAALGCAPADLTWRAGVDLLSLGGTKNGCLAAEALIVFGPAELRARRMAELAFRRKRAGHLFSKMRAISLQLDAYLADGLWLRLASQANDQARRLGAGLAALPGVSLAHPVEANEIFAYLPPAMIAALKAAGYGFYDWDGGLIRLVAAFDTDPAAVDGFLATARAAAVAA